MRNTNLLANKRINKALTVKIAFGKCGKIKTNGGFLLDSLPFFNFRTVRTLGFILIIASARLFFPFNIIA